MRIDILDLLYHNASHAAHLFLSQARFNVSQASRKSMREQFIVKASWNIKVCAVIPIK